MNCVSTRVKDRDKIFSGIDPQPPVPTCKGHESQKVEMLTIDFLTKTTNQIILSLHLCTFTSSARLTLQYFFSIFIHFLQK